MVEHMEKSGGRLRQTWNTVQEDEEAEKEEWRERESEHNTSTSQARQNPPFVKWKTYIQKQYSLSPSLSHSLTSELTSGHILTSEGKSNPFGSKKVKKIKERKRKKRMSMT